MLKRFRLLLLLAQAGRRENERAFAPASILKLGQHQSGLNRLAQPTSSASRKREARPRTSARRVQLKDRTSIAAGRPQLPRCEILHLRLQMARHWRRVTPRCGRHWRDGDSVRDVEAWRAGGSGRAGTAGSARRQPRETKEHTVGIWGRLFDCPANAARRNDITGQKRPLKVCNVRLLRPC